MDYDKLLALADTFEKTLLRATAQAGLEMEVKQFLRQSFPDYMPDRVGTQDALISVKQVEGGQFLSHYLVHIRGGEGAVELEEMLKRALEQRFKPSTFTVKFLAEKTM